MDVRQAGFDQKHFRQVLGQFPTGVVVVTAISESGEPLGMTVGSFTSVSLDPPLVAFLPGTSSSSWRSIRESGDTFCINVLSADQENICRAIASRKTDKFQDIPWTVSPAGNPIVSGATAYIDCVRESIHDAGDHQIVIGRVQGLDTIGSQYPLLFFRGGYGSFRPRSLAAGDRDLLEVLKLVDRARPHMEEVAAQLETEITAVCLVGDELVLAATAGYSVSSEVATRVGQRVPFTPPIGASYAAWGPAEQREQWLARIDPSLDAAETEHILRMPDLLRSRGYGITFGHGLNAELERVSVEIAEDRPGASSERLRELTIAVSAGYNPEVLWSRESFELRSVTAPVFDVTGAVAFTLTMWGPPGEVAKREVERFIEGVLGCAAAATASIGGRAPGVLARH